MFSLSVAGGPSVSCLLASAGWRRPPLPSASAVWVVGHGATIAGTAAYTAAVAARLLLAPVWYAQALVGILTTYTVVACRRRADSEAGDSSLLVSVLAPLRLENVQLLALALLWCTTAAHPLKLVLFGIYSAINAAHFGVGRGIGRLPLLAAAVAPLLAYLEPVLLEWAAWADLGVVVVMCREAWASGSGYALAVYLLIYALRAERGEMNREVTVVFWEHVRAWAAMAGNQACFWKTGNQHLTPPTTGNSSVSREPFDHLTWTGGSVHGDAG